LKSKACKEKRKNNKISNKNGKKAGKKNNIPL